MSETKKRIRAYKEALPGMRDRVFATALLLLVSLVIITVSSFAWLTLSRAPEAIGISTQIAANGNLEIALSKPDGVTPPDASAVGDSSSTEGKAVKDANLTWGNLINLADPAYGLEKVILRPAVLNNDKLGTEPFRSVVYGEDGRVTHDQNAKFSYCTWEQANDEIATPHFGVTGKYGVRAIATVTERFEAELGGTTEDMVKYAGYLDAAETENRKVQGLYPDGLLQKEESINALATVMGYYMQARVNTDAELNNPECTDQIAALSGLYNDFLAAMYQELNAMVTLANVQQFVYTKSDSYTPLTAKNLREKTAEELAAKGVHLKDLASFLEDLEDVEADAAQMAALAEDVDDIGTQVYTNDIRPMIDRLVTVGSSVVVKPDGTTTTISAIGGIQAALDIIGDEPTPVIIQDGILARFEHRTGAYVNSRTSYPKGVEVTVKAKRDLPLLGPTVMPATVNVHITTQYYMDPSPLFAQDVAWTQATFENSGMANGKKILTAGDTYGLAVDLWVRTNAGDPENGKSYLVLEGEVQYEQDTGTNANGESIGLLFYYTEEDPNLGVDQDYYVYQTEDGKWYEDYKHHESNNELTAATLAGKRLREAYKDAPVGYEGVNRVWEEIQQATLQPPLSAFNTTQGNGSCYTFYADSPQDQQMILNLLQHMYVVFTDGGSGYLSMARFDTEENHYYAAGGKVTVPLVIMDTSYTFVNAQGETVSAVAELQRNVAQRITAMVYLDGRELSNKEALAATDIQGTLNLQFGSNVILTTLGDQGLQEQERVVTATVETANADNILDFYTDDDLSATVTVTVEGDQPANVKAFFQREVNAFQGSRQETMVFRKEGNSWICDTFVFPSPGKYVLRSVMLDGVEYELGEQPVVTVEGVHLSVLDVSRDGQLVATRNNTIMTADNMVNFSLSASVNTDDPNKMPKSVVVEFLHKADGSSIGVDMKPTASGGWTGTTSISVSGYYEMSYVLLDGVRYDLGNLSKTFDLYLGLSAIVEAMPGTPQIVPLENGQAATLGIRARIVDNSGGTLDNLSDIHLFYKGDGNGDTLEAADIAWNEETKYYEGNFHLTKPGIYRFNRLESQGNTIFACKSGVVFYASNNSPASYEGCSNSGNTQVIMPDLETGQVTKIAQLHIQLRNSDGAQIKAYFTNGKDTYWVSNTSEPPLIKKVSDADANGVATFHVELPKINGSQAGNWRMTKLELGNVSDENGRSYTVENPMVINLAEEEGGEPTYTVIDTINTTLYYNGDISFNGAFMEAHTVSGLSVDLSFKDAEGNTVLSENPIDKAYLHYTHQNDHQQKGGYTFNGAVDEIKVEMTNSGDGIRFNQTADITLRTAGTYKLTSITYRLQGDPEGTRYAPVPTSDKGIQFTVESSMPTVVIQDAKPNKTNHDTTKRSGFAAYSNSKATSSFSTHLATLYVEAKFTSIIFGKGYVTKSQHPTVTLQLGNVGMAETATMTFGGPTNILMYVGENSDQTPSFTFAKGSNNKVTTTCTRYIGQYDYLGGNWEAAGTLTSSTLVLTYGEYTYTFTVPTITIKNLS